MSNTDLDKMIASIMDLDDPSPVLMKLKASLEEAQRTPIGKALGGSPSLRARAEHHATCAGAPLDETHLYLKTAKEEMEYGEDHD